MKDEERLFLAIGGADPELVARSERRHRNRRLYYGLAAAACLALVLACARPSWTGPSVNSPGSQEPPAAMPDLAENRNPGGGPLFLPEHGHEIGTLRLLSYTPEARNEAVDFLIYVNEEQFHIHEENGLYRIRSTQPLPEDVPECGMDIFHLPGVAPDQAKMETEAALRDRCPEISSEELAAALPGSLYLRAGEGLEWNSEAAEFWFVDDGQDGTFVLTARYFLEAEEGLGSCFRDMVSSFRVVDLNEAVPDWMGALYGAAGRLFPALFTADLSGVSDLLAEGAEADAYYENVWPEIAIVSVDYTLDNDQDPASATVSVKHRLNRAEGDSYNYLTMELIRQDGSWYLYWSGIEK